MTLDAACCLLQGKTMTNESSRTVSFSRALELLKEGHRVTRVGWNGADQWLKLQTPDEHSKMRKPYIYISPVDGELVPWLASQTDLLDEDWIKVDE
jgi:hypothetical protein